MKERSVFAGLNQLSSSSRTLKSLAGEPKNLTGKPKKKIINITSGIRTENSLLF